VTTCQCQRSTTQTLTVVTPFEDALTLVPTQDDGGQILMSREAFFEKMLLVNKKAPFRAACTSLGLTAPSSANLARLREIIVNYCRYPATVHKLSLSPNSLLPAPVIPTVRLEVPEDDDEPALLSEFDVDGGNANEIMGYDDDDRDAEELEGVDDDESDPIANDCLKTSFQAFQTSTRVDAARRAEGCRRAGGLRTQKAVVRDWMGFMTEALKKGEVKDDIVDEHSLLLYIKHSAERPKCDGNVTCPSRASVYC